jgi:hypothetical protein
MSPTEIESENDCAGEDNVQLENKITGRESQGAWYQNELIGGKPPVVK